MPQRQGIISHAYFAACVAVGVLVYHGPIRALAALAFKNETYSHITLIPLISLFFLATRHKAILDVARKHPVGGGAICVGGLLLYGAAAGLKTHLGGGAFRAQDIPNDYLTLCMAGAVAWVIGSFVAVYGTEAFRTARFALLFLVFAIPMPMFLLNWTVKTLQVASAYVSDLVFGLAGTPYHRDGMVFAFPNVTVQVAEVCSGIRSSLSLFILSVICGFVFLRTTSRRVLLALAIFPITVVKNAFRIATVTLLANHVDMRFLTNHWIHQSGGIPFFAVGLAMFIPLVWILRKTEAPQGGGQRPDDTTARMHLQERLRPPVGSG